ncbi:hypothetical protein VULLAG_LOCUS15706 [Vulpes lagopus]
MFYRNGAAGAGKRHQGGPVRVQQRQPELAPDRALYSDSTRSKELRERSSPRLSTKRVARSQVRTAARKPQGTSPSLAPAVQSSRLVSCAVLCPSLHSPRPFSYSWEARRDRSSG